jgi:hypothetical protein
VLRAPAATPEPAKTPVRQAKVPPQQGTFPIGVGLLWVGLAMVVGVSLRFLEIPDYAIPVLVGLGVGAAVVLVLRQLQTTAAGEQQTARPAPASEQPQPAVARKSAARRSEGRSDPGTRLSGLKRRIATSARKMKGD